MQEKAVPVACKVASREVEPWFFDRQIWNYSRPLTQRHSFSSSRKRGKWCWRMLKPSRSWLMSWAHWKSMALSLANCNWVSKRWMRIATTRNLDLFQFIWWSLQTCRETLVSWSSRSFMWCSFMSTFLVCPSSKPYLMNLYRLGVLICFLKQLLHPMFSQCSECQLVQWLCGLVYIA